MATNDDDPEADGDRSGPAGRINLRDHPSTVLVLVAAVGSALAWTLHRWLGRGGGESAARNKAKDKAANPPAGPRYRPGTDRDEPS